MSVRPIILILGVLFSYLSAAAQEDKWLSIRASEGFLLAHTPKVPQLLGGHSSAFALSYSKRTSGEKEWHRRYARPYLGVSASYLDFGNDAQLGYAINVLPFIDFPLKTMENGAFIVRLAVGATYVSKRFDSRENTRNQLIGSQGNVGIQCLLRYQHEFGRMHVGGGLSFSHASNGSYQLPNLGANVPAIDFYLGYRLNRDKEVKIASETVNRSREAIWDLELGVGLRESNTVSREKHPALELRLARKKPFSEKMSYILGADVGYSKSSYAEFDADSIKVFNSLLPGLKAGLALDIGSTSLFLEVGGYVHDGYQELGNIYNRFGGRKVIDERYTVSLVLKTHFARADYFALGVGYRFL